MPDDSHEGGDPACWAYLFETEVAETEDDTDAAADDADDASAGDAERPERWSVGSPR